MVRKIFKFKTNQNQNKLSLENEKNFLFPYVGKKNTIIKKFLQKINVRALIISRNCSTPKEQVFSKLKARPKKKTKLAMSFMK